MRIFLIFMFVLFLPFSGLAESVTITFLGDCTIGGEDRLRDDPVSFDAYLREYGYDYFFQEVQSVIAHDDLTIANLEGCFIEYSNGAVEKTYNFRGPKHYVNVLTGSSIEAVSFANNHSLDYGYDGVTHTTRTLEEANLPWFGTNDAAEKTWIYEKGNVRLGFAAMEVNYWYYKHRTMLKNQIEQLKNAGCQAVIVVMHGGEEYNPKHWRVQRQFADAVISYGADLVIGHHPHVLQGIDVLDGRTVCYSLGNFVFGGNAKVRAPYSAMFQFALDFAEDGEYLGHQLTIIPVLPSGNKEQNNYQPILAAGADAETVMKQIQHDTPFTLSPYVEGIGAVQPYVPAPAN